FKEGGWCNRRSKLEKCLMLFLILILIVAIGLMVALIIQTKEKPPMAEVSPGMQQSGQKMCTTTDCVRVASRIHDAIDYKVKPCDNFYEFACGTWKKKNVIPEDKSAYSSFDLVADDVNVILK
ncbi:hypothetical protein LOTGIDRAFT_176824, partial [Lottia gigantea]